MSKRLVGKEGLAKHLFIVGLLLAGLAVLSRPASAGTITVAWDPMVDDTVTGYRVYVGTASGNYSQTFDVPADREFFIFRNAFMGVRYYFAVAAAFENSRIGPRSYEVSAVGTRTVPGSLPDGARVSDPTSGQDCGLDCFVVTELAHGLGKLTSLTVASDGSVFVVEAGRRVIAVRGGAVLTAFEAERGTELRDIALDPQYASTHRVFVSLLRARDRVTGDIEVVRLREVAGSLGEPSTIVIGPAVPLDSAAPLAVGDDGLVYVAVPALTARHPYSASILAFDQDGRVPARQRSPVVARGLEHPLDLAWDAQARSLWLLGSDDAGSEQLLGIGRDVDQAVPLSNVLATGERATAVAMASGTPRRLLVAGEIDLVEKAPNGGDAVRISLENYGVPIAVATAGTARYVAVNVAGVSDSYSVVRVEDGGNPDLR